MSVKLAEIGKLITAKRIDLSISRNKLAENIELPIKYLDLIENGELDNNYHKALVIRYLRIYLNYLNLDTEEIIIFYKDSFVEYKSGKHKFIPFNYKYFSQGLISKLVIIFIFLFILGVQISVHQENKIKNNFSELEKALYR